MSSEKPIKLRADLLFLQQCGGDPDRVAASAGYNFAEIEALTPLPTGTIADLFDVLASTTAEDFSVKCALATHFPRMGLLGFRLMNCDTVREVLETWARYSLIIGYPLASTLQLGRDRWSLRFRPRYPLSPAALRHCMETSLIGLSQAVRAISGHEIRVIEYDFPFPAPDDLSLYEPLAPAHLQFAADIGSVSGDRSDLRRKLASANPESKAFCETFCQNELLALSKRRDVVERVREYIANNVGKTPTAADTALQLGTSERNFHRRLARQGARYSVLVEEFRRDRAQVLLGSNVSIKNVAFMLGYSDVESFRRAFRRWHGVSPTRWRILQE